MDGAVTDAKPKPRKHVIGLGDKFRPKDEKGDDYWTVVSLTRDLTVGLYAFTSDKTTRYIPWPEFKDDWVRVK